MNIPHVECCPYSWILGNYEINGKDRQVPRLPLHESKYIRKLGKLYFVSNFEENLGVYWLQSSLQRTPRLYQLLIVACFVFFILRTTQPNDIILLQYSQWTWSEERFKSSRYFNVSLGSDWSDTKLPEVSTISLLHSSELNSPNSKTAISYVLSWLKLSIFIRDFLNCTRYISLYYTSTWFLCIDCTEMGSNAPNSTQ